MAVNQQCSVKEIENGYLVTAAWPSQDQTMPPGAPPMPGMQTDTYCADLTAVGTTLQEFFGGQQNSAGKPT